MSESGFYWLLEAEFQNGADTYAWIKNRISVFKSLAYVPIETSFKLGSSLSEV